jgi:hypothetical protein
MNGVPERDIFNMTCAMGRKGVCIDPEYVGLAIDDLTGNIKELREQLPIDSKLSVPQLRAYCEAEGWEFPETTAAKDEAFLRWADKFYMSPSLEMIRRQQALRSRNRLVKVMERLRDRLDGKTQRVEYELIYCGASTGRWSGGNNGVNFQNFNRDAIDGYYLRSCIVAPPGHVLCISDYAQIEARVLYWLVKDRQALGLIADTGMSVYEAHARATMGYTVDRPLKLEDPGMYALAKARVLGLGYGCGAERFVGMAAALTGGDVQLTFGEALKCVEDYRSTNPKIVQYWRHHDRGFKSADGGRYIVRFPKMTGSEGFRGLIYRDVNAEAGTCRVKDNPRTFMYGAKIVENECQGVARDVIADAMWRCWNCGYEAVLSVHDELVFEMPEDESFEQSGVVRALMERAPYWAADLPLEVEDKITERYEK